LQVVENATPSFASVNLFAVLPYLFCHPARILHASFTDFGKGSFFCNMKFPSAQVICRISVGLPFTRTLWHDDLL